jgi:hypothetical protein
MISALTIAAPLAKKKINASHPGRSFAARLAINFVYYLVYSALHVASMLIVMTYNGGLVLTMIFTIAVSYSLFGSTRKNSDMPINCCAAPP